MSVVPYSGIDSRWYNSSRLSPFPAKSFSELIPRLRRFDRDSVVLMAAACLWEQWLDEDKSENPNRSVLLAYGTFLACLALGKCAPVGRPLMDKISFKILVGELYNIFLPSVEVIDEPVNEIKKALIDYSNKYPILSKINVSDETNIFEICLYVSKVALVQNSASRARSKKLETSIKIYTNFKILSKSKGFCTQEQLKKAENVLLGTSLERFTKSVWMIMTIANNGVKKELPLAKLLEPDETYLNEDASKELRISDTDLRIVANRLSFSMSDLRHNFQNLNFTSVSDSYGLGEMWSLHNKPIVRINNENQADSFLVVNPWFLMQRSAQFILYDLIDYLEENLVLGHVNRAYGIRGEAYEAYLYEKLSPHGVQKVDEVINKNYSGKKFDFLWEDKKNVILMEAKVKIRPNSDPTFSDSNSLVTSWLALAEAIEQGRDTLNALSLIKNSILIIATDENYAVEITQFLRVVKHFNLLSDTSLDALAICSSEELENMVKQYSPQEAYGQLASFWKNLNPLDINVSMHDYNFFISKEAPMNKNPWEELERMFSEMSE